MFHKFMKYSVFLRGRNCISRVHFIIWPCVLGKKPFLDQAQIQNALAVQKLAFELAVTTSSGASLVLQTIIGDSY